MDHDIVRYPLLPAQKNIENMMLSYSESALCLLGGYFQFEENDLTIVRQMLSAMPAAHGALRLGYYGKNQIGEIASGEADVPVYERSETDISMKEQCIRDWIEKPIPFGERLCSFAIFHFGDGSWCGCEKFHHFIIDRAALLILVQWQRDSVGAIRRIGFAQWKRQITSDDRYLELLAGGEEKTASAEQAGNWMRRHFSDASGQWNEHPAGISAAAGRIRIAVPVELHGKIHDFAKSGKVSVESIWYLALFAELCLRRGISHAVIGRMMAYRPRKYRDVVGLFSRVIPIAYDRQPGELLEQCAALDGQFLAGLRYGCYSLEELQEIMPEADLAFDILVSYYPMDMEMEQGREYHEVSANCIDTPLRIWINDGVGHPSMEIYYQTAYYDTKRATELAERCFLLLDQICNGCRWEQLSLLSERDHAAYRRVNSCGRVKPEKTPAQMFIRRCLHAIQTGDRRTVLRDNDAAWDGRQALVWFYQAADWLRAHGAEEGMIVGVCAERSVRLPLLLLAIQHVGAAVLTVAVNETQDRRKELLSDSGMVVGDRELSEVDLMPETDVEQRASGEVKRIYPESSLRKQTAYLMYTSGSSGLPKAVRISVYSLMCRLEWMNCQYGCGEVVLQKTPYTFDVSMWELLLVPAYGGCLYLMEQGEERLPDKIGEALIREKITRCHFVPGMLSAFLDYWEREENTGRDVSLAELFVSGETLTPALAERTRRIFPGVRLINLYGPTECTIDVSWYECGGEYEPEIPIGRAVANTQLYVMAPAGTTVLPIRAEGELCVVGDLVGMGYLGEDQGGYFCYQGQPAYRTGDRCFLREDGELVFCGRLDSQTKLRGMRIDTAAVEYVLMQQEGIRAAYAAVEGNYLAAWYEADREIVGLSKRLEGQLPRYNIPSVWRQVEQFPRMANGKPDIPKLLSLPVRQRKAHTGEMEEMPATKAGRQLLALLKKYAPQITVSPDDDILEAGLDSLTAIQIVGALRDQGYDCSYGLLYQYPTIRRLERVLEVSHSDRKGMDWLVQKGAAHLLLCIPYGGGGSEIYGALARKLQGLPWDIAVVSTADFGRRTVREMAEELAVQLSGYQEYTLFGYCVGTALAVALLRKLESEERTVCNIYLAASLPDRYFRLGKKKYSVWDMLPDWAVVLFLERLQPKNRRKVEFTSRIAQFRMDAAKFFDYMEYRPACRTSHPVTLLFGDRDPLTRRWPRRYQEWRRYFRGSMRVKTIKGAGHYFLPDDAQKIASLLWSDWQDMVSSGQAGFWRSYK